MAFCIRWFFILLFCALPLRAADKFLPGVKRVLFLGDSITYAGSYIEYFEAYVAVNFPDRNFEIVNAGLSSETVSGLSEPGHAAGKFPRPDLHERLDRALAKFKPDLVFACYGMNDGIYQPLAEERFEAFRKGMKKLHEKVEASGAKIIHITPPTFDPGPKAAETSYNDVLDAYSKWLLEQGKLGWRVFDLHGPMTRELQEHRIKDPGFAYAKDRVHPNAAGHWLFTREILRGLNQSTADISEDPRYRDLLKLVHERSMLLRDAWLSEIGHLRPGVRKGLPVAEAQAKAAALEPKIREAAAAVK